MKATITLNSKILTPDELTILLEVAANRSRNDEICARLQAQAGLQGYQIEQLKLARYDSRKVALYLPTKGDPYAVIRSIQTRGQLITLSGIQGRALPDLPFFEGKSWRSTLAEITRDSGVSATEMDLRRSYVAYLLARKGNTVRAGHEVDPINIDDREAYPLVSADEAAQWFAA